MDQLIAFFKANRGAQQALARHLGLYASTVCQWKAVPADHVRKVSEFTGIEPNILRPDLYKGMMKEAAE